MKKSFMVGVAVVALSLGTTGTAQAGLLEITGGVAYTTPAINTYSSPWEGRVSTTNTAMTISTTAANVTLTYEFIYQRAGFVSTFASPFGGMANTAPFGTTVGGLQAVAGALTFSFQPIIFPALPNGSVALTAGLGPYSLFATTNAQGGISAIASGATGDVVYLAFDDGGVSTEHDDMIIRVTATAVPEPTTLALFGAGLLALGAARRARRRTA